MPVRKILRPMARAAAISAVALALSGCVSPAQRPSGYSPSSYSPAWAPYTYSSPPALAPGAVVRPRQQFYQQPAPEPSRPPPVAVGRPEADQPADAVPPPLVSVEPVGRHPVDQSCTDYWDWCHFFW
jgi:hypothetical protein